MLGLVGWTKDDVYTTNIVKCCPPNNRTPTEFETMQCALYLEAELSFIKPRYMILMGHTAQLHFHPKVGAVISAWDRHYVVSPERTDICIPHSSFVVRARDQWENLYLRSFNKIKELVSKEG
jgi:DNA polymerase